MRLAARPAGVLLARPCIRRGLRRPPAQSTSCAIAPPRQQIQFQDYAERSGADRGAEPSVGDASPRGQARPQHVGVSKGAQEEKEDAEEFSEENVSCSVIIRQGAGRGTYRFGMDALLLATDLPIEDLGPSSVVCELGTANGVVALAVGARFPEAEVFAVERQQSLYDLLCHNVARNVLVAPRVRPVLADVRSISAPAHPAQRPVPLGRAALVLCNPPFFATPQGNPMKVTERVATRHELHGGLPHFLAAARALAAPLGFVKFVLPPRRLADLMLAVADGARAAHGGQNTLHLWTLRFLHPEEGQEAYLLEAVLQKGRPPPSGASVLAPLYLRDSRTGEWSDEMAERVAFAALPPRRSAYRASALEALSGVDVYKGAVERFRRREAQLLGTPEEGDEEIEDGERED